MSFVRKVTDHYYCDGIFGVGCLVSGTRHDRYYEIPRGALTPDQEFLPDGWVAIRAGHHNELLLCPKCADELTRRTKEP